MQFSLTLPVPALVVAATTEVDEEHDWCSVYTVRIMAGEVEVASYQYADEHRDDIEYAYDEDTAASKALTTFGERLRDLLS